MWGPEELELAYQIEKYDSKWNEIRSDDGNLLYWANRQTRQIYRVGSAYVGGVFIGRSLRDKRATIIQNRV